MTEDSAISMSSAPRRHAGFFARTTVISLIVIFLIVFAFPVAALVQVWLRHG